MPCENPYPKDKRQHKVEGLVDPTDYYYIRSKFYMSGLHDKIISNLYSAFVNEVKRINSITPLEGGLFDARELLADIISRLSFVERRTVGGDIVGGDVSPQHDAGAVGGVRETVRGAEVVSTEPSSGTPRGKRGKKAKEK